MAIGVSRLQCWTTATPGGGTKTNRASDRPEFTVVSPKRTVTVFPSSSWTTACRTSQLLGIDGDDQAREQRLALLRRQVQDDQALGVGRLGRVEEARLEVLPHLAEPLEEAPGRARRGPRGRR